VTHDDGEPGRRRESGERLPVDILGQDRPEDGLVWLVTAHRRALRLGDGLIPPEALPVSTTSQAHLTLLTSKTARRFRRGVTGNVTYRGVESDDVVYSPELELRETRVIPTFSDHDLCLCEFDVG
jgi:hypothetical protein